MTLLVYLRARVCVCVYMFGILSVFFYIETISSQQNVSFHILLYSIICIIYYYNKFLARYVFVMLDNKLFMLFKSRFLTDK